jgi:hypothetical protein
VQRVTYQSSDAAMQPLAPPRRETSLSDAVLPASLPSTQANPGPAVVPPAAARQGSVEAAPLQRLVTEADLSPRTTAARPRELTAQSAAAGALSGTEAGVSMPDPGVVRPEYGLTPAMRRARESSLPVQRQAAAAPEGALGFAAMFASTDAPSGREAPIPGADVQREAESDAAPEAVEPLAELPSDPATTSTPPTTTTAPPAGLSAAGVNLEEMARRLFDPLSARLRAELWLDRERAGLVMDLRP